jgi:ABC-type multidrug transport system ATPase subunit
MDEPTTGLDAMTALESMQIVRGLAGEGKTIVSTIQQPSFEILDCFDNILCEVKGNIVYNGPLRGISEWFRGIWFEMPGLSYPADFLMRIINKNDIRIGHEANIRETKKDMIEKIYKRLSFEEDLPNFSRSSVRSESQKLA